MQAMSLIFALAQKKTQALQPLKSKQKPAQQIYVLYFILLIY